MCSSDLFAGAFFGHMVNRSGAADAAGAGIVKLCGGRALPVLLLVGLPIFVVGMFVGLAGIAVLSAGVYVVPALRRLGFHDATIAAFVAVIAVAGMIAPPVNVPAMHISDGVNMPWTNVSRALLALAVPLALAALVWFSWLHSRSGAAAPTTDNTAGSLGGCLRGLSPILVCVAIWILVRVFPTAFVDPAAPLVLVIGGLVAVPMLLYYDPLFGLVDVQWLGTILINVAAVLTVISMLYYLRKALPHAGG